MAISNKEYRYKGYFGCRCKYCFNKKVIKIPSVNNSRLHIKKDTEKEFNNSLGLREFDLIEESIDEEDYYQGYIDYTEEEILDSLTEEQIEEYLL